MDKQAQQSEPPDERPDFVEQSLTALFDVAPPAPEFRASLLSRLEARLDEIGAREPVEPAQHTTLTPGRLRGYYKWAACAAVVMAALGGLFFSPQSYTWAAMVAAIEQAEWVEIVAELRHGGLSEAWFNGRRRIVAVSNQGNVRYDDLAEGTSHLAVPDINLVGEASISRGEESLEARFLGLLLAALTNQPDPIEATAQQSPITILAETWRKREDGVVELEVQVSIAGSPEKTMDLVFELDPNTKLPRRAWIEAEDNEQQPALTFAYADRGPDSIRALGVPDDYPIVPIERLERAQASGKQASTTTPPIAPAAPPSQNGARQAPEPHPLLQKYLHAKKKDLPPADSIGVLVKRIDELLENDWKDHALEPVVPASDQEFLRRVYLDLAGRIPTVTEVRDFLKSDAPNRHGAVIDKLLSSYDHASHLANVWRTVLIPESADLTGVGGAEDFERWLTERFRENQPYDQLTRDLLLAEGRLQDGGPLVFFAAEKLRPEEIAKQASRAFLGVRMDCAQCHDHFFDDTWKQDDFWGFAAFFAQLSQPEGRMDRVSPVLRVRDSNRGEVTLPEDDQPVAPRFPQFDETLPDVSEHSRREVLVAWLTASDNPFYARATVNRVWSQLFGRGLVNPVDDMRLENKPINPRALDTLSQDFIRSGYDLRKLYATLTRTRAYRLSSSSPEENPKLRERFAQMNIKCFTAQQLYDCLSVATRINAAAGVEGVVRFNNLSRQQFLDRFGTPGEDATEYQVGIAQALTLMNGGLTQNATELQTSGLLRSLQAPLFDDEERVEILFLATVSRFPSDAEKEAVIGFLADAKDAQSRSQVLSDVLWALLNSAEFTLIH